MNKRWLVSPDGQDFVRTVAALIANARKAQPRSNFVSTHDAASDWPLVKNAYFQGIAFVYGRNLTPAEAAPFDAKLDEVYEQRFDDGYPPTPDVGTTVAQAQTLGNLTVYMYKLHIGDIGTYPGADPSVTLSVYHLEWARDFLGFWLLAKTRWPIPINPISTQPSVSLGQEFDSGCSIC